MRYKNQHEHLENGRAALRALSNRAMRECLTQSQYLAERETIVARLPEFPRTIRREARAHGDGYHRAMMDHNVIFLYLVDGELFRTTNETRLPHLRAWDALPREKHHNMPSGLYWINAGNPKVYFQGE